MLGRDCFLAEELEISHCVNMHMDEYTEADVFLKVEGFVKCAVHMYFQRPLIPSPIHVSFFAVFSLCGTLVGGRVWGGVSWN